LPQLQKLYDQYSGLGMKMVAINVISEQDGMVPDWRDRNGFTFPILVGTNSEEIMENYRMTAAPLNFLLDSEGKVLARFEGYSPGGEREIEKDIRQALKLDS
jgi:glutathione peroxidase-family protein